MRARELGVPFDGRTGAGNAITDVAGVTVGQATRISEAGSEPARVGVTAIRPRGESFEPVFGAWYTLNGCGEMTGTTWLEESGLLYGPVLLTNTFSVSVAREAANAWLRARSDLMFALPVVAETFDGFLNGYRGQQVSLEEAWAALDGAAPGPVAEGNVGGGTGMVCYDFKGGIGTSSRLLDKQAGGYTLGVLVQANHGVRQNLIVAGAPAGRELPEGMPREGGAPQEGGAEKASVAFPDESSGPLIHEPLKDGVLKDEALVDEPLTGDPNPAEKGKTSSILVVVATDAPLLPHQLKRLARRVPLGIARTGGLGQNFSGDIFLAFSTASLGKETEDGVQQVGVLSNRRMNPLIEATIQATEEAIVNALLAAETMVGVDGNTAYALPHERLREILKKYNRLSEKD